MRACLVTGYVPIMAHPRSAKEYGELGEEVFANLAHAPILPFYEKVEQTWLHKMAKKRGTIVGHSVGDNPAKNSLAYHCVQHQKFAWLLKASITDRISDTFVWIDYGISHIGVTAAVIDEFMTKIQPGDFAIPGCWPREGLVVSPLFPCWRFCGGVLVVPREALLPLFLAVKHDVQRQMQLVNNIDWEVNTLARIEPTLEPKPRWYAADHNSTIFTNYGASLCQPALSPVLLGQLDTTSTRH